MKFTLEITLGNEAMSSRENVTDALHNLAWRMLDTALGQSGNILDLNGNTVGHWEFTEE